MKKIVKIVSALILTLIVGLGNINAAETVKNISVKIETNNKTFVNQKNLTIKKEDLTNIIGGSTEMWTKDTVAMHAIIKAMQKQGLNPSAENVMKITHSDFGPYISSVDGLDAVSPSGWGYTINHVAPDQGVGVKTLKDNDNIVVYYIDDYNTQSYAFFNKDNFSVKENQNINLRLQANVTDTSNWTTSLQNVSDGTLVIKDTKTNKEVTNNFKSNKDGNFNFKLAPGTYELVAKSSKLNLSRASAIVNVTKDSTNTNQNKPKPLPKNKTFKKGNTTYYQKLIGKKYFTTKSVYKKGSVKTTQYYKLIKSKNRLTKKETYTKYKKKNVRTYYNSISYYANGKVKVNTKLHKDKKTNKYTKKYKTTYKSNGKKSKYIKISYKKGKTSKRSEYVYNKKGQLKSNKYGKAYRYTTKYNKKGKALKTDRKQYNKRGKLTNIKKVKIRKSF